VLHVLEWPLDHPVAGMAIAVLVGTAALLWKMRPFL
jgi:hypothetical protein